MKILFLALVLSVISTGLINAQEKRFNKATACIDNTIYEGNAPNNGFGTIYIINQPFLYNQMGDALFFTAKNNENASDGIIIAGHKNYSGTNIFPIGSCEAEATGCTILGYASYGQNLPFSTPPVKKILADVDFRAGTEVQLRDGFIAEQGCEFHAYIAPKWTESWVKKFDCYADVSGSPDDVVDVVDEWTLHDNPEGDFHRLLTPDEESNHVSLEQETIPLADNLISEKSLTIKNWSSMLPGTPPINPELRSRNEFSTSDRVYGRYEGYIQVTYENMVANRRPWFAFWMIGSGNGGGDEYDILERQWEITKWDVANHQYFDEGVYGQQKYIGAIFKKDDFDANDQNWHLYSVEIIRDEVRFLFDDMVVWRGPQKTGENSFNARTRSKDNPCFFIIGNSHYVSRKDPIVHGDNQTLKMNYIKILEMDAK